MTHLSPPRHSIGGVYRGERGLRGGAHSATKRTPRHLSMSGRCVRAAKPCATGWEGQRARTVILRTHTPPSSLSCKVCAQRPACRESIGAETGLPHTKPLFRVKLTPCFPVVVELARSRTGREPKYLGGRYHEGKGSRYV